MWTLGRDGLFDYLLAEPGEPLFEGDERLHRFYDLHAARDFLARLPGQASLRESLRAFAWERIRRGGGRYEDDDEILAAAARALVGGELAIVSRPVPTGGVDHRAGAGEEASPLREAEIPRAPRESWIEIELVDELDRPVPSQRYAITLPGGAIVAGSLGADGRARVVVPEPGTCRISFTDLDEELWVSA